VTHGVPDDDVEPVQFISGTQSPKINGITVTG
jgi:hypothetical protein